MTSNHLNIAIVFLILWSNSIETNVSAAIQLPSSVVNMTMTKQASIYSAENGCGMIIVRMMSGTGLSMHCNTVSMRVMYINIYVKATLSYEHMHCII